MHDDSFTTEFTVDEPADKVFAAIADVRRYWGPGAKGKSENEGDEFTFRDSALMSHFRVSEVVPERRVVWQVLNSETTFVDDRAEWDGTRIVFDVAPEGAKTRLRFTHEGLTPAKECFQDCSRGWTGVINESLRHLIATGRSMFDEPTSTDRR